MTTQENNEQNNHRQNLAIDYHNAGFSITQPQLQELQNETEARHTLLLQAHPELLLKYPCEIKTKSGHSKICHML